MNTSSRPAAAVKIMDDKQNLDLEKMENIPVHFADQRISFQFSLTLPQFLLYLHGHTLQIFYQKIFKIP